MIIRLVFNLVFVSMYNHTQMGIFGAIFDSPGDPKLD